MKWFGKDKDVPDKLPPPERPQEVRLFSEDSYYTRAKKIVESMGHRGAIHGLIVNVMSFLEMYDTLDGKAREAGTFNPPRAMQDWPIPQLVEEPDDAEENRQESERTTNDATV